MLKNVYKDNVYEYMLNLLCSMSMTFLLCYQLGFNVPGSALLLINVIMTLIVLCVLKRYTKVSTYIIVALIILLSFVIINHSINMAEYISWLSDIFANQYKADVTYEVLTLSLCTFVILFPLYFALRFVIIRYAFVAVFTGYMVYACITEINISKFAVISMVVYMLLTVTEYMCYRMKGDRTVARQMTSGLAPFMLCVFIVFSILVYPNHRYSWSIVKEAFVKIKEIGSEIYNRINPKEKEENTMVDYDISIVGYSEDGNVEGNIKYDDTIALLLRSENENYRAIYLKGNVSNYFDGEKWTTTNNTKKSYVEYELDTVELLYAIHRAGEWENLYDYVTEETVMITYVDMPTNTIFLPDKTLTLDINEKNKYTLSYNHPMFQTTASGGREYMVSYLRVNQNLLKDIIEKCEGYTYSSDNSAIYSRYKYMLGIEHGDLKLGKVNLEEVFSQRAGRIYEDYMNTDCVSDSVRALAEEITKDCDTDYRKLKALESYLRKYTYTTNPKPAPEGKDFLEYFLFESKEGYCTYFSTAFAMMSRCIGIPSRYVQGFVMDGKSQLYPYNSDYKYMYNIPGKNAHAWVECYIEGVGFVAFEPTSGYESLRNVNWEADDSEDIPELIIEEIIPESQEKSEKDYSKAGILLLLIVAALLLLAVTAVVLFVVMRVVMYNARYKKADTDTRLALEETMIFNLAAQINCEIEEGETFSEYMRRLAGVYSELRYQLVEIAEIFDRVHYDNASVTEEELSKYTELRIFLTKEVKENTGRLKYLFSTYCKI